MKKLTSSRGEALLESLVAIAVITLCFVFMTTALSTAKKINDSTTATKSTFMYDKTHVYDGIYTFAVSYDDAGTTKYWYDLYECRDGGGDSRIKVYETDTGFVYYERAG